MKKEIVLLFVLGSSVAVAGTPAPRPDDAPHIARGATNAIATAEAEAVTVTGLRPQKYDRIAPGFVPFRNIAPRKMSSPPALDLVTEPIVLTVRTGNSEALHDQRPAFPFGSVQDRVVRDSDVLKFTLARFRRD